jgi:chorismate-pyruvate lyase
MTRHLPSRLTLNRQPFFGPDPASPAAQALLTVLLAQDGSTTRLCEALSDGPLTLQVLLQQSITAAPAVVRQALPEGPWIERVSSLVAHGQVLTDNLVYIATPAVEPALADDLHSGHRPIGHLLRGRFTQRRFLNDAAPLFERLWQQVGSPDPAASRAYVLSTPQGPLMVVVEAFRRGLRASSIASV